MAGSLTAWRIMHDGRSLVITTSEALPGSYSLPKQLNAAPVLTNGSRSITFYPANAITLNDDTTYEVKTYWECSHADRILYTERSDNWTLAYSSALYLDTAGNTSGTQTATATGRTISARRNSDGFTHEDFKAARSTTGQAALNPVSDLAADAWYIADLEAGADGSALGTMTDQSGNGYNSTKSGAGTVTLEHNETPSGVHKVYRPTGAANTFFDVPTLTYDPNTDTVVMAAVILFDGTGATGRNVMSMRTAAGGLIDRIVVTNSTDTLGQVGDGTFTVNGVATGRYKSGEWIVVTKIRTPTTWTIYVNGVLTSSGSQSAPASDTSTLRMFGKNDGGDTYNSDVAEIGFWTNSLTEAQILALHQHLATKYSLTLARTIFVAAAGSDSNAGTQASPLLTLAEAAKYIRPNFKDRMRLNRGDSFDENFPQPVTMASVDQYTCYDAYGTGARPKVVRDNGESGLTVIGATGPRRWGLFGIHFDCPQRDPDHGSFVGEPSMNNDGRGISVTVDEATEHIWEDMLIEHFGEGIVFSSTSVIGSAGECDHNRVIVQKNCKTGTNIDPSTNRSQGNFYSAHAEIARYECVEDLNGWSDHATLAATCPADQFSHNNYWTFNARIYSFRGACHRGASIGYAMGCGGVLVRCLTEDNAIGGFIRLGTDHTTGHGASVGQCWIGHGRDSNADYNWGMNLDEGKCIAQGNIAISEITTYGEGGFAFIVHQGAAAPTIDLNTRIVHNTIRWYGDCIARDSGGSGANLVSAIHDRNIMQASGTPGATAFLYTASADDFAKIAGSDYNAYDTPDASPFNSNGSDYTFAAWKTASSVDANSRQETIIFNDELHPGDYEDYLASSAGATTQDFIDRLTSRACYAWTEAHSVGAFIDYIRENAWQPVLDFANYGDQYVGAIDVEGEAPASAQSGMGFAARFLLGL